MTGEGATTSGLQMGVKELMSAPMLFRTESTGACDKDAVPVDKSAQHKIIFVIVNRISQPFYSYANQNCPPTARWFEYVPEIALTSPNKYPTLAVKAETFIAYGF
ncbi:MAG: hypothetical protein JNM52_03075 [Betaproteobacteria bacterium]|nr:hypothetical protein [Betaproteobacteria bacterium]